MPDRIFPLENLGSAPLIVDALYQGSRIGTTADDAISKILPKVGNSGGFRGWKLTSPYIALYTTGEHPDWPDTLDPETGVLSYFGDNRSPGRQLHEPRGNQLLRDVFHALHDEPSRRNEIPPFLLFEKTGTYRDVRFKGLAVPGLRAPEGSEDLVAIWKATGERRFQNYRAMFTVLDVGEVSRTWIDELRNGERLGDSCPEAFKTWVLSGEYRPLLADKTLRHRTKAQQLPDDAVGMRMLQAIHTYFQDSPVSFEACAAELWRMQCPAPISLVLTRASRDGGRDATGHMSLGPEADRVHVDFALEAKCYDPIGSGAGVREVARLISRLRFRQFGVFVTTSYLGNQAYQELREDGHPVVVISGRDIVDILRQSGITDPTAVVQWLLVRFDLDLATV